MYKTCPKCGHERTPGDQSEPGRCPACGLIYEKWLKRHSRAGRTLPRRYRPARGRLFERIEPLLVYERPQETWVSVVRGLLLLLLVVWGVQFIFMDHRELDGGLPEINYSFLHGVNLVFHEAGHILFIPLGDFMRVLGGSLMQLIVPGVAMVALLRHGDPFGAAVGLWWLGQSLMDLAPYIHDAAHGRVLLLGGGTGQDRPGFHDWTNLLGRLDMLQSGHALATFVDALGVLLMLLSFVWAGMVLWRAWRTPAGVGVD